MISFTFSHADVAELVDAQVSEACGLKLVMVRFHSSAFFFYNQRKPKIIYFHLFTNKYIIAWCDDEQETFIQNLVDFECGFGFVVFVYHCRRLD